ncbi:hypothetical protein EJ05DRAFT_476029, partial [Pseudovirgaria hyperparasitica]
MPSYLDFNAHPSALPQSRSRSSGASAMAASIGNQVGHKIKSTLMQGRPNVDIELNSAHGIHGSFMTSYSTMDKIEGTVNITATQDTRFDELDITFVGICKTYVDRLTSTPSLGGGRTTATHRFLRLSQPINEEDLPHPRIFAAGQTYKFPFTFVVPQHLLPRACSHKVDNDTVRDAHLRLPPSMGDPEVSGFASNLLDDMAPEMAKVLYVIKVRGLQYRPEDDEALIVVDRVRKVRIKPAFEEQPPLSVDVAGASDYRLRQVKTIRKGLLKGKSGTLIMEASQPKPLHLPGARTGEAPVPISTVAKVVLRFDPTDDSQQPPKLGSLTSRLKVITFHSSVPRTCFPVKSTLAYDISQGYYCMALPLASRCIANTQWERQDGSSSPVFRRDSAASTVESSLTGIPAPSDNYHGKTFYTARILVPITLPYNKNFLPTFHSCLISRTYTLSLSLSTPTSSLASALTLKVPIQVSQGVSPEASATIDEELEAAQDVEDMMRPRFVSPPSDEYGNSQSMDTDLPPQYTFFAPRTYATNISVL